MNVAVCILNFNGAKYLQEFLPTVLATTYKPLQIVVIDNASTDNSYAIVTQHAPNVQWLPLNKNYGYAEGYNQGLAKVTADVFVLLNSDVAVTPNWVEPIIQLMQDQPTIAAVQPKIKSYAQKNSFEYAGAAGGYIDKLGYTFCRGRIFDRVELDNGQYNTASPIMWASGAALFVRSEYYKNAGGLDGLFFAHMEEVDLCWRLQRMNKKIWYEPNSEVYHVGGGTLPAGNERKVFLNFRNNLIMLLKNLPFSALLWVFPLRIALDGVAAWQALLTKGDFKFFKAVAKAHFAVFGYLFKNKTTKYGFAKAWPNEGLFKRSIVWQYFINKTKEFSQLKW
jgi:GT2 family glycosyltransferase